MKDQLGGKMMKEFTALRAKTCNYLTDNKKEDKKAKDIKKVCHKKEKLNLKITKID